MDKKISTETIYEIAKKIADNPVKRSEAEAYSVMLENIQKSISSLKYLNISDVEPATIYFPVMDDDNG